jgi:hypothetical protein
MRHEDTQIFKGLYGGIDWMLIKGFVLLSRAPMAPFRSRLNGATEIAG